MKLFYVVLAVLAVILTTAFTRADALKSAAVRPSIERGRYVAKIAGCNDCHTPMYGPQGGVVPEKDWLIGVPVGWKGGWGTTYAANLRQRAASMTEDQWVVYLKNLRTRPPMPYFAVNEFTETDSRSLYRFVRSLGNHPQEIPPALPPGEKPTTPYFDGDIQSP